MQAKIRKLNSRGSLGNVSISRDANHSQALAKFGSSHQSSSSSFYSSSILPDFLSLDQSLLSFSKLESMSGHINNSRGLGKTSDGSIQSGIVYISNSNSINNGTNNMARINNPDSINNSGDSALVGKKRKGTFLAAKSEEAQEQSDSSRAAKKVTKRELTPEERAKFLEKDARRKRESRLRRTPEQIKKDTLKDTERKRRLRLISLLKAGLKRDSSHDVTDLDMDVNGHAGSVTDVGGISGLIAVSLAIENQEKKKTLHKQPYKASST